MKPVVCLSCRMDAGNFGKDPRARHACSYDSGDHKVRSINWVELEDVFLITHANGVKLEKPISTLRGHETRFNGFLLRCPLWKKARSLEADERARRLELRQRAARIIRNGAPEKEGN